MEPQPATQINPFDEPRIVSDPEELFNAYKNQIFIGAAIIIIAVLGGTGWWAWKQNREATAQAALHQADSIESWRLVADQYANTSAGGFALLQLANAHKENGEWPEVVEDFSTFLQYQKKSPLAPVAQLGLARALEVLNNYDEAQVAYQNILSSSDDNPFISPARIGLARVYLASGQPDAARQTLSDLIASTTDSTFLTEAEDMLKKMN
jgi:predicted negative regulator of RcsB-dependent stress response